MASATGPRVAEAPTRKSRHPWRESGKALQPIVDLLDGTRIRKPEGEAAQGASSVVRWPKLASSQLAVVARAGAAWCRRSAFIIVLSHSCFAQGPFSGPVRAATGADLPVTERIGSGKDVTASTDAGFARLHLEAAIRLFDREFRVSSTGQYLDAIDLGVDRQIPGLSSIAATGMGLISLAMADALGLDPQAAEKAELTLTSLLESNPQAGFHVDRSAGGWFTQYIDSTTGVSPAVYKERYSTIDTSLLAIGAVFVGRYFEQKQPVADSASSRVVKLSRTLLLSVDWPRAVRDLPAGRLHALLVGRDEAPFPPYWGEPFDEYVLIPCLGRYVDQITGRTSALSRYWDLHIGNVDNLPTTTFGTLSVLARANKDFVSHFTHQFAFYLCGSLGRDAKFQAALSTLRDADKQWFARRFPSLPDRWWGLGAGSALIWDDKTKKSATELYVASTLGSNAEDDVFSPSIMAGFLALDALKAERHPNVSGRSEVLTDLRTLFSRGECLYRYHGLEFLWRCSAHDPFRRVRFVQGIDFSTYILGLSTQVPEIGLPFFRRHAP